MEDALVTAFYNIRVDCNTEHVGYGPTLEKAHLHIGKTLFHLTCKKRTN